MEIRAFKAPTTEDVDRLRELTRRSANYLTLSKSIASSRVTRMTNGENSHLPLHTCYDPMAATPSTAHAYAASAEKCNSTYHHPVSPLTPALSVNLLRPAVST